MKGSELRSKAHVLGLEIQHDCGGYRVVSDGNGRNIFPDGGICPTATKKECSIFLLGYIAGKSEVKHEV